MTITTQNRADGLTVREVLETSDGARLMWMAAWRMARREGSPMDMLLRHHTARTDVAARLTVTALAARMWPRRRRMSLGGDAR